MVEKTNLLCPFKMSDEFQARFVEHVRSRNSAKEERVEFSVRRQLNVSGTVGNL